MNRRPAWGLVASLAVVLAVASCTAEITRPVDEVPPDPDLTFGESLQGSAPATGSARYLVAAPAGRAVRLSLQGTSGAATDTVVATARVLGGTVELGRVASDGASPSPSRDFAIIGAFTLDAMLEVEVRRVGSGGPLPFELSAAMLTSAPERASDTLRFDQLTIESIDDGYDVDQFVVDVNPGERVAVFMSMEGAGPSSLVQLRALVGGSQVAFVTQPGSNYSLYERSLILESELRTRFVVEVSRGEPRLGWTGGTYGLMPVRVLRSPETAAPLLALNVPVTERIDEIGDIDEFRYPVNPGDQVRVEITPDATPSRPLTMTLQLPGAQPVNVGFTSPTVIQSVIAAEVAGDALVRVQAPQTGKRDSLLVGYELTVRAPSTEPEHVPATLASGVTVVGERINYPGDIDDFRITVPAGKFLALRTSATTTVTIPQLNFGLGTSLTPGIFGEVETDGTHRSTIIAIPVAAAGEYLLRVRAIDAGTPTYDLTAWIVDSTPESVPEELPLDSWLTGERFDAPGDRDVFRVADRITPSQVIVAIDFPLDARGGVSSRAGSQLQANLSIAGGGTRVLFDEFVTELVPIDIRLFGRTFGPTPGSTTEYRVIATSVNPAPEGIAAEHTVPATIQSELTEFDVDNIRLRATPGAEVRIAYTAPPLPLGCTSADRPSLWVWDDDSNFLTTVQPGQSRTTTTPPNSVIVLVVSGRRNPVACDVGAYTITSTLVP